MTIAPEHAELNEHLNAYLDGALEPPLHDRLDEHLQACVVCRLDLAQLRSTRATLRALPALRAPRPFTIQAPASPDRVGTGRPGRSGSGLPAPWLAWVWRLGSLAAAACLLLAVVTATWPVPLPGGAESVMSARGGAAPENAARPPAPLANRDSSQRVAPAARQPAPEAAMRAAEPNATPEPSASPPAPAGTAQAFGPASASGPAATPAPQPTGGAEPQAQQDDAKGQPSDAGQPPAGDTASSVERRTAPEGPPRAPASEGGRAAWSAGALWLALAAILALASAVAFGMERRSRADSGRPV